MLSPGPVVSAGFDAFYCEARTEWQPGLSSESRQFLDPTTRRHSLNRVQAKTHLAIGTDRELEKRREGFSPLEHNRCLFLFFCEAQLSHAPTVLGD